MIYLSAGGPAEWQSRASSVLAAARIEQQMTDLADADHPAGNEGEGAVLVPVGEPTSCTTLRQLARRFVVIGLIDRQDTSAAVRAFRAGVFDCVMFPFEEVELISVARAALAESAARRHASHGIAETRRRIQTLTEREQELMPLICDGLSNKQVARQLDISVKTVAHHRAQILKKTAARNTAHMVQLVTRVTTVDATAVSGRAG